MGSLVSSMTPSADIVVNRSRYTSFPCMKFANMPFVFVNKSGLCPARIATRQHGLHSLRGQSMILVRISCLICFDFRKEVQRRNTMQCQELRSFFAAIPSLLQMKFSSAVAVKVRSHDRHLLIFMCLFVSWLLCCRTLISFLQFLILRLDLSSATELQEDVLRVLERITLETVFCFGDS